MTKRQIIVLSICLTLCILGIVLSCIDIAMNKSGNTIEYDAIFNESNTTSIHVILPSGNEVDPIELAYKNDLCFIKTSDGRLLVRKVSDCIISIKYND